MTIIKLTTIAKSDKKTIFNLSRSIDFHQLSLNHTSEKAIAGITLGMIELGETVTWKARHFGWNLTHQSKITAMEHCTFFTDEMVKGCFRSFVHHHYFEGKEGYTKMIDEVLYETPYGILGKAFDYLILEKYLRKLLKKRNKALALASEKQSDLIKPL